MEVLKACLNPEPVKRLSAIEVLALPYFDDIHTLLQDTDLQEKYDLAYLAAAEANAPSTPSLWTACSQCTGKRHAAATSVGAPPQEQHPPSAQHNASPVTIGTGMGRAASPSTAVSSAAPSQGSTGSCNAASRPFDQLPSASGYLSASSTPSPPEGQRRPHPPPGVAPGVRIPSARVQQDVSAKHRATEGHFDLPSLAAPNKQWNTINTGKGWILTCSERSHLVNKILFPASLALTGKFPTQVILHWAQVSASIARCNSHTPSLWH